MSAFQQLDESSTPWTQGISGHRPGGPRLQQELRGHGGQQSGLHGSGLAISRVHAEQGEPRDAGYAWQRGGEKIGGRCGSEVLPIPDPE